MLRLSAQPQSRSLSTLSSSIPFISSLPPPLVPPAIFIALLITLWTWKCLWIILLQDKLLYLSWLPPFSRSDKIEDHRQECAGVTWVERRVRSGDGTRLVICEGRVGFDSSHSAREGNGNEGEAERKRRKRVVIAYFQGNGGSTPMRLPLLSGVLRGIAEAEAGRPVGGGDDDDVEYILVALSYRGYWKSAGRATQRGIELDAQYFLVWIAETYASPETDLCVVLWGHSLGAAVASSAVVKGFPEPSTQDTITEGGRRGITKPPIAGLILEAPISSIKDMLISLYPQKWLPYRYLWPFSWNNWDVAASLEEMARYKGLSSSSNKDISLKHSLVPPIFLMSAGSDEVIPVWVADQLENKARSLGLKVGRKNVKGAMHIEGPLKLDGKRALVDFIRSSGCK
ncbi:Alpha/Beta hydrolase protein [Aspergillus spectabilis]